MPDPVHKAITRRPWIAYVLVALVIVSLALLGYFASSFGGGRGTVESSVIAICHGNGRRACTTSTSVTTLPATTTVGTSTTTQTSTTPTTTPVLRYWKPNPILATVAYGGSSGSLNGLAPLDILGAIDISFHKLVNGTALNELLAANPNMKILVYKAQADMVSLGSSFPISWPGTDSTSLLNRTLSSGISYEEALSHDSWLDRTYGTNPANWPAGEGHFVLRNSSGQPIPAYGYANVYMGDIGLPAYQKRWVENALLTINRTNGISQPGKIRGLWVDNTVGYPVDYLDRPLCGGPAVNQALVATKYQYHAQFQAAVRSFWTYLRDQLRDQRGLTLVGNSADRTTCAGSNNGDDVDAWWAWHGAYLTAVNREHWVIPTPGGVYHARRNNPAWYDFWNEWTNNMSAQEARHTTGFPGGVWAMSVFPSTIQTQGTPADFARYGYASFLMRWDGRLGVSYYVPWSQPTAWYIPDYRMDLSVPIAPMTAIDATNKPGLLIRRFQGGLVIINTHVSNAYTLTASPDGRTYYNPDGQPHAWGGSLPAGRALILANKW